MAAADVADSRIVRSTPALLVFALWDAAEKVIALPGVTTVHVVDGAGVDVKPAGSATVDADGAATVALSARECSSIDRLTATWSTDDDGGYVLGVTQHDVVGGPFCSLLAVRDGSALNDPSKHNDASLAAVRTDVEYQIEDACHRAFVPRFWTEALDGSGSPSLILSMPDLREVVFARYWTGTAWASIPGVDLSWISSNAEGEAILRGGVVWPAGRQNVQIGYRYGWDRPPPDLVTATIDAIRHRRASEKSALPERSISIQGSEFGNVVLATPGLGRWITAVPGIDEVLNRRKFSRVLIG